MKVPDKILEALIEGHYEALHAWCDDHAELWHDTDKAEVAQRVLAVAETAEGLGVAIANLENLR